MSDLSFLHQLPTTDGGRIRTKVQPLTKTAIGWWRLHIQPYIAKLDRVDAEWNWTMIDNLCTHVGRGLRQDPQGYAIVLPHLRDPQGVQRQLELRGNDN
jgi:hypothetical protein